jgi:P22 coat protein - gene protein 5
MANQFATPTLFSKYILAYLHTNCMAAQLMDRQFDDSFGKTGLSVWKPGTSIKVKYPVKFSTTTGPALSLQDINQQSATITVSTQRHIDFDYTSIDETLTLSDMKEQFFMPAAKTLAAYIDADAIATLTPQVYNLSGESLGATTGALPAHYSVASKARQYLSQNLAPTAHPWVALLNPASHSSLASSLVGLYNPQMTITNIFEEALIAKRTAGFDWYESQNIANQTYGTRLTAGGTVAATPADGSNQISITGGAGNDNLTINTGDRFQVSGCYPVNPETKIVYSDTLQWFVAAVPSSASPTVGGVVAAGAGTFTTTQNNAPATQQTPTTAMAGYYTFSAGGAVTITVSPVIYQSNVNPLMNMTGLGSGGVVTFWGNPGLIAVNNLCFAKDAFAFVSVPMVETGGVDTCKRETVDNVSLRTTIFYDGINDRKIVRIDAVYGFAALYPQLAAIISG